jgi:glycosyltransferase involved in cell wall biosynthesis
MKVLILASHGESLINFRGHLLRTLVDAAHQVAVAAPNISPDLEQRLRIIGVDVVRFPLARAGMNPISDLRTLTALIALMRRFNPDLMLAYTIKPVVYGLIAAEICGIRRRAALITGLGYAFGGGGFIQHAAGALARSLYRISLRTAQVVILQNPDDRQELIDHGLVRRAQTRVVNGSGVDLAHYRADPPATEPVTFLLIARLLREKGIVEYATAASGLRTEFPHARWHLIGPRDLNPNGIPPELLAGWQRDGVIDYQGEVDDVRPALKACSVYVLPSYREGTPRTVLEAMACGRAVITTDVPGCRETVQDGVNGFLVRARDAADLGAAMRRLLLNPGLIAPMGRAGRRIAEERYDVHAVNRHMLNALIRDASPVIDQGRGASH